MTAAQTLGWVLVHSLWLGALAAAWLGCLLALFPAGAARARYALAVGTLVLMLALPVGMTVRLHGMPSLIGGGESITLVVPRVPTRPGGAGELRAETALASAVALAARARAALEPRLPWVVGLWLGGVILLSLRLVAGWRAARHLATVGTSPAPPPWSRAAARVAARLRVTRPVRVLQSTVAQVPAVIGWLRPVILLPASVLTGLTPLQLDALLAHELAHVRRHDYLVNLLQTVIETLLFYHPAVWWVSRCVREERERCCDDLAVAVCGDTHTYATALFGLERMRVLTPALAMAAGGGSLLGRIQRLVAPTPAETLPRWVAGVVAVTLVIGGAAGFVAVRAAPQWPVTPDPLVARGAFPGDADERRDAVEELGRRSDSLALAALIAVAWEDRDEGVRREAVETLGELPSGAGRAALLEVAQSHPDPGVRREALETIAEALPADLALEPLDEAARRDPDVKVKRAAVTALGRMRGSQVVGRLARLARTHASADIRREALEQYAEGAAPEDALLLLTARLADDPASAVQREAIDELEDLPAGMGIPAVIEVAWSHPDRQMRAEALRRLRESDDPRAHEVIEEARLQP